MRAEFLQAGGHHLGQVRFLVALGHADGLINLAFAQRSGHRRRECPRLLASRAEGEVAVDHHRNGERRHDEQDDDDGAGKPPHGAPQRQGIVEAHRSAAFLLQPQAQHRGVSEYCRCQICEKHRLVLSSSDLQIL